MRGKKQARRAAAKPPPHLCTDACAHTCGEVGGRTQKGQPCRNPGGWGIAGEREGGWALCRRHDPSLPKAGSLNLRQARFVAEYCGRANGNAARAAELAGYSASSRGVLAEQAYNLLQNPKVQAAIEVRLTELSMPATEVLKRISDHARGDVTRLIRFTEGGNPALNLTPEILEEFGSLIKEIETDPVTGGVTRVKLVDAQTALRDLARIRRLFSDSPIFNVFMLSELSDDELRRRATAAQQRFRGAARFGRDVTNGREKKS